MFVFARHVAKFLRRGAVPSYTVITVNYRSKCRNIGRMRTIGEANEKRTTMLLDTKTTEHDREMALIKRAAIISVILLVLTLCGYAHCGPLKFEWSDTRENYTRKIETFLADWFVHCSPKKLKRALSALPHVIDASEAAKVNPEIVASIISHESTWNGADIGKRGEIGLMQVLGSHATTADEQLKEGIRLLMLSYEHCGTIIGAISYYGTGYTCKPYRGARSRITMAKKIDAISK
jgi:hypothetical protein